jgi:hypothetical protein
MSRANVALLLTSLLPAACQSAPPPPSEPLPLVASAPKPPLAPSLQGRYRVEATLALDPSSATKLGAERIHTLDALRAADPASLLVAGELAWTLGPTWLVVRQESLKRAEDGSYRYRGCEAEGAVSWLENDAFVVSREIRVRASSSDYSATDKIAETCSASVPSGTYRVVRDAGELTLRRADPEASWGYLLVSAAGQDLESEARRLSGYSE